VRVVHISTDDHGGGAAVAAFRIHRALCGSGVDSIMLVGKKLTDDARVFCSTKRFHEGIRIIQRNIDSIPFRFYKCRWSLGWLPSTLHRRIAELHPDVVHLHLVSDGFLSLRSLQKLTIPIVWTMHDMWAFTGGCHYSGSCTRYIQKCGACPQLSSHRESDITRLAWSMKASAVKKVNMTVLGPSLWMANCARKSSIFRNTTVQNIPYIIDPVEFKPVDQKSARTILGLPVNKRLLLFGGMSPTDDPRKGFRQLVEALQSEKIRNELDDMEVIVFGADRPDSDRTFPLNAHFLGQIHDSITLNLVYSAADVFVAPSLEENLANTVLESLACGTPVVAFRIGGMPDMIAHTENGYLAEPFEPANLAAGIHWVLSDKDRLAVLRKNARRTIEERFNIRDVARQYIDLYNQISDQT
jgi:glycosyltransferase involved in cell wall biosynthesis